MSTTPRIYIVEQGGDALELSGDAFRHLGLSRRHRASDEFITFDGTGIDKRWQVVTVDGMKLRAELVKEYPFSNPPRVNMTLAFSPVKGGKSDDIIALGTQMGVNRFMPFLCSRTVVKLSGKRASERVGRWNDICVQNSGFSLRTNVPKVEDVRNYAEILNMPGFDVKCIFYEENREGGIGLSVAEGASVLALVGPEGGFEPEEVEAAKGAGFRVASLGTFVLKAEVAAAKAVSLILNIDKNSR